MPFVIRILECKKHTSKAYIIAYFPQIVFLSISEIPTSGTQVLIFAVSERNVVQNGVEFNNLEKIYLMIWLLIVFFYYLTNVSKIGYLVQHKRLM